MTPEQRTKFINERVEFWREHLDLPRGLKINLKFVTHREDDDEKRYGRAFIDAMQYKKATIEIYDAVFTAHNFKEEAEKAVVHEMLHLAIHPLISYANNLFSDDSGKQKHLEDLEETFISTLEEAFYSLTRKSIKA